MTPLRDRRSIVECFYASVSFSPGSEVAVGDLKYVCALEEGIGIWTSATILG